MFSRCLVCHRPFPANAALEHFATGRRVAYDPERGRLWALCARCGRWTLAPIEERWEALEELERLARGPARLLSETENIALLAAGDVEIVRIGRANRAEEAWWRYGRKLLRRYRRHGWLSVANNLVLLPVMSLGAGFVRAQYVVVRGLIDDIRGIDWREAERPDPFDFPAVIQEIARRRAFGRIAWRGHARCVRCGDALSAVPFSRTGRITLRRGAGGEPRLVLPCRSCDGAAEDAGLPLAGADARHLLRRVLSYRNFAGASEAEIQRATGAIDASGSAAAWADALLSGRPEVGRLPRMRRLALEIVVHEEMERRLLDAELSELERQWREAEEIAAIVDGELTPLPKRLRLRR